MPGQDSNLRRADEPKVLSAKPPKHRLNDLPPIAGYASLTRPTTSEEPVGCASHACAPPSTGWYIANNGAQTEAICTFYASISKRSSHCYSFIVIPAQAGIHISSSLQSLRRADEPEALSAKRPKHRLNDLPLMAGYASLTGPTTSVDHSSKVGCLQPHWLYTTTRTNASSTTSVFIYF